MSKMLKIIENKTGKRRERLVKACVSFGRDTCRDSKKLTKSVNTVRALKTAIKNEQRANNGAAVSALSALLKKARLDVKNVQNWLAVDRKEYNKCCKRLREFDELVEAAKECNSKSNLLEIYTIISKA